MNIRKDFFPNWRCQYKESGPKMKGIRLLKVELLDIWWWYNDLLLIMFLLLESLRRRAEAVDVTTRNRMVLGNQEGLDVVNTKNLVQKWRQSDVYKLKKLMYSGATKNDNKNIWFLFLFEFEFFKHDSKLVLIFWGCLKKKRGS